MGSCVSVHKDPGSTLRYRLSTSFSKDRKLFAAPSPAMNGGDHVGGFYSDGKTVEFGLDFKSPNFGSKDETFFDSRAWLDSDCEDDFFSVKGEFTPSAGSTPNHQTSFPTTPRLNKTFIDTFPDTKSEPSPRKKLAQLLLETLANEEDNKQAVDGKPNEKIEINGRSELPTTLTKQSPKSSDTNLHFSGANSADSSQRTPNGNHKDGKEKASKATNCCLPAMVPTFNLYERKKQKLSPEIEVHNGG